MARIIYSGLVTSIRGSIGGTTFQSNAYGQTIKNKPNMVKPNTPNQARSKQILSAAVKSWSIASIELHSNWDTFAATFPQYAKHNPSSILSGYAAFVKYHTALFLGEGLAAPVIETPHLVSNTIDSDAIRIICSGGTVVMENTWVLATGAWKVNVFISRPFTFSQNFVGTSPLFVTQILSEDGNVDITDDWIRLYGRILTSDEDVNVLLQLYDRVGGLVLADVAYRITTVAV